MSKRIRVEARVESVFPPCSAEVWVRLTWDAKIGLFRYDSAPLGGLRRGCPGGQQRLDRLGVHRPDLHPQRVPEHRLPLRKHPHGAGELGHANQRGHRSLATMSQCA